MIRAVKNIIIFMTIILASVAIVNYFVDPLNTFHTGFATTMADYLCEGKTVYYPPNYNERLVQETYISRIDKTPKTVILGSSRGMLLDHTVTGYEEQYNHCVSGAAFEDVILGLAMYYEKGDLPDRVVIEVSPWNFDDNNPESRWKRMKNQYDAFYPILTGGSGTSDRGINFNFSSFDLFSFTLFQDSVATALKRGPELFKGAQVYTNKPDESYYTKFSDGSIQYGSGVSGKTDDEVLQSIRSTVGGEIYRNFPGFHEIGKEKVKQFEAMLNWLRNQNIEVAVYLAPFPQTVYEYCLSADEVATQGTEQYLLEKSKEFGYELHGSFNPANMGLSDTDFYDSFHAKKEVTPVIWNFIR